MPVHGDPAGAKKALFNFITYCQSSSIPLRILSFERRLGSIFFSTIGIAIVAFLLFYYVINSPRFNRWWSWLIVLLVSMGLAYGYGFQVINVDIVNNDIAPSLASQIGRSNAILFGIYNSVFCGLVFFILSEAFRWWSRNCKHAPWTLLPTKLNNGRHE